MSGLSSITPAPDFGAGLTLASYTSKINDFSAKLDSYNQAIAAVDELQNQLDAAEDSLSETSNRMLAAAKAHYGPNSNEYEQAGGKRTRDRKRPSKKELSKTA